MHKKFVAPEKLNVFMLLFLTQHVPSSPCQPHVQPTCLFFFHTVYRNQSLVTYFCFTYCKSIDPENVRDSRAGLGAWQHDWQFWLDVLINLWHESKNEYHPRWQRVWSNWGNSCASHFSASSSTNWLEQMQACVWQEAWTVTWDDEDTFFAFYRRNGGCLEQARDAQYVHCHG